MGLQKRILKAQRNGLPRPTDAPPIEKREPTVFSIPTKRSNYSYRFGLPFDSTPEMALALALASILSSTQKEFFRESTVRPSD